MKNIPLFTTPAGAASLTLREIPYTGIAYVRIQASEQPQALLEECCGFCTACGAEKIYAAGHPFLEALPFHTAVVRMQCLRDSLPDTDAALWPVLPENAEHWRSIYNRRMSCVPNTAWMSRTDCEAMCRDGSGYFVHRGETLLGIGKAAGSRLEAVISCVPHAGRDVVLALNHVLSGEAAVLEVANTNLPAVSLYEKLGFLAVEEISRWYCLK